MHVYRELVRMHREEGLSFSNCVTFNLDEYHPMQPWALQSYRRFMNEHLFDHVDLPPGAIHVPDGSIPLSDVPAHCQEYERQIEEAGGIDLQILGLGRTGHIGFNERGSSRSSTTRLISLDRVTRIDAASDFFGEHNVPRRAITMGVATILKARRILLMAFGENKATVVREAVEGPVTPHVAASYLQQHSDATVLLDYAAAAGLTRVGCPWVLGPIRWEATQVKKAACWLSQKLKKPLLKLTDDDFNEHSLQDLLAEQGPAYDICLSVFYQLQHAITGWPGGKPAGAKPGDQVAVPLKLTAGGAAGSSGSAGEEVGDIKAHRQGSPSPPSRQHSGGDGGMLGSPGKHPLAAAAPNRHGGGGAHGGGTATSPGGRGLVQLRRQFTDHEDSVSIALAAQRAPGAPPPPPPVFPKRILVLSPHPDDDVISMGGTLIRLLDQGHEVHVAYMTSGNIAVWDEDCLRFADFAVQFGQAMGLPDVTHTSEVARQMQDSLERKQPGEVDSQQVLATKALIRRCEARSALRTCGGDLSRAHFLEMPFYKTGKVVKDPLGPVDIALLVDLFERIRPHQIYAAGDLSDPHGTHRTCLQAVFQSLGVVRSRGWYADSGTAVLLYRGAWQEWEPWEADLAVPLGPAEMQLKVDAIFKHQSQKDRALFPGADPREFWQRALDRNRATAALYDRLGLQEFEAMELFVIYDPARPSHIYKAPEPDRRHEKVALKAGELLSGAGAAGVGGAGALRSP
ncbi:glucosamine-6-phosphate deaminase isoform A [Micractinium conductrix]|uniref:Glucosamine-6-phosphate deaminase isoform A n=1 Tax=Micractinium conductrix TaxID=554055 RepID=A0A2P6VJA4_9CHLO|nr:glucosamine-6-phosphate deaminase isoform A [Micractinium conductrix]|eukprot:PSC74175.1 glucosamine-6-phosphate deaminase isoform A [Micractinium conductrix]